MKKQTKPVKHPYDSPENYAARREYEMRCAARKLKDAEEQRKKQGK